MNNRPWSLASCILAPVVALSLLASCSEPAPEQSTDTKSLSQDVEGLNYQRYTLENGLTVLFHKDTSDPVVAVILTAHVGSAREIPGRTGFAHLFEHLLFLDSENLGQGGLDKLSARIGGSGANGSTNMDQTNYLQTVPRDALEKMIWAEADKLGYFINTVTEQVLAKEKQVVLNEKRQSYDNRPYGFTHSVIAKGLYDPDHPYSWPVIGSMKDLNAATLQDVKTFFKTWYVPNNVTLTLSGDFDSEQAKLWVSKYFSGIKRGQDMVPLNKRAAVLDSSKKLYHEDNFARAAELTMVWPTVPRFHPDSYALDVLEELLLSGKKTPFNRVLVDDRKLTPRARSYSYRSELAGYTAINARAFAGGNLDDMKAGFDEAFALFEAESIDPADLERIKVVQETNYYSRQRSTFGKAIMLTDYSVYLDDPGYGAMELRKRLAVTAEDVMRVYHTYIKGKAYLATSFVPKGQLDLILEGSVAAGVVEETIVPGKEKAFDLSGENTYVRTPSAFDRTIEPPYGPAPVIKTPLVWESDLTNGMKVLGITDREVPLVEFNITLDGGLLLDDINRVGAAQLMGLTWDKGTTDKTTAELQDAIKDLGARINISVSGQKVRISGYCLSNNFEVTLRLLQEILLTPRFDQNEFNTAKRGVISSLKQQAGQPGQIARNLFMKLTYGADHILSRDIKGTLQDAESMTLEDVKAYHAHQVTPKLARFHVAGDVSRDRVLKALDNLSKIWQGETVDIPDYPLPAVATEPVVYFYDVPGAKQSVIRVGYLALAATDPNYHPAGVMNYILGGGGFASRLTQDLREGKGYTYGIRSGFTGSRIPGPFMISSSLRTNVTLEGLQAIKSQLENYGATYSVKDHDTTQNYAIKSKARAFEVLRNKLSMLEEIGAYNKPYDYVAQEMDFVRNMTKADVQSLAEKYLPMNQMIYLVVGDAASQFDRLKDLGLGTPVLLEPSQ